jgi:glyoxylase-like metal-dependent hydrolase (beta-lactamase superfamily II)
MAKTLEKDYFYIFDVGQGNCQLVIYGEEKTGFLYDCGSKAYKLQNRRVSLRRRTLGEQLFKDNQSSTIVNKIQAAQSLSLKEILSGLKYCFVFLSHADQDHISLVNRRQFSRGITCLFSF